MPVAERIRMIEVVLDDDSLNLELGDRLYVEDPDNGLDDAELLGTVRAIATPTTSSDYLPTSPIQVQRIPGIIAPSAEFMEPGEYGADR